MRSLEIDVIKKLKGGADGGAVEIKRRAGTASARSLAVHVLLSSAAVRLHRFRFY